MGKESLIQFCRAINFKYRIDLAHVWVKSLYMCFFVVLKGGGAYGSRMALEKWKNKFKERDDKMHKILFTGSTLSEEKIKELKMGGIRNYPH